MSFTIYCKNDIGVHTVLNNQDFKWFFNGRPNAVYFCNIVWRDRTIVYDIYNRSRDVVRCPSECFWEVTNGHLIGYAETGKRDIIVDWSRFAA
ncbi:hypothetical protein CR513_23588, partial [Mucuna pruriens]